MSQTLIQPYLTFNGRCEEAIAFYKSAINAEVVMMMRYNESPEPLPPEMVPPGSENKIMHSTITINGQVIMAADGCSDASGFSGIALSLSLPTEAEVHKYFDALANGGQVTMPLTKTFWSPCFGMLVDQFGVAWMLSVYDEH